MGFTWLDSPTELVHISPAGLGKKHVIFEVADLQRCGADRG